LEGLCQAIPRSLGNKKDGYRVMINMSVSVDDMVPKLVPLHANRISRVSSLASRPRLVKGVQGLSIVDASVVAIILQGCDADDGDFFDFKFLVVMIP
jgi:hypothetical protein